MPPEIFSEPVETWRRVQKRYHASATWLAKNKGIGLGLNSVLDEYFQEVEQYLLHKFTNNE
jgi:hypothetical protein